MTTDGNNDYIRWMILKEIDIGEIFTWGYAYDIVRRCGKTSRNSPSRALNTLLEYKYIERVGNGIYRKLANYSFTDIEFLWISGNPDLMIKKKKVNGLVVSLDLDGEL